MCEGDSTPEGDPNRHTNCPDVATIGSREIQKVPVSVLSGPRLPDDVDVSLVGVRVARATTRRRCQGCRRCQTVSPVPGAEARRARPRVGRRRVAGVPRPLVGLTGRRCHTRPVPPVGEGARPLLLAPGPGAPRPVELGVVPGPLPPPHARRLRRADVVGGVGPAHTGVEALGRPVHDTPHVLQAGTPGTTPVADR